MNAKWAIAVLAFVMAPVLLMASCAALLTSEDCTTSTTAASTEQLGGLSNDPAVREEQLANATVIVETGADLGLPVRGQAIGVMTAMGESSLVNVNYGDDRNGVKNPDGSLTCSLGLFQQQWCLGWGTKEQVLDPVYASTAFFTRLVNVAGWEQLEPTIAAHKVQRNADPYHYEKYWDNAVAITEAVSGSSVGGCTPSEPTLTDGWTYPLADRAKVTSRYGMRVNPVTGIYKLHAGTDLGAACGTQILAANSGTVIAANGSGSSSQKDLVRIDHGDGVNTLYMHMYPDGIFVKPGDKVQAGQVIAEVGSAGNSTGCHLHFEVNLNGEPTDPEPFMAEAGVPLS